MRRGCPFFFATIIMCKHHIVGVPKGTGSIILVDTSRSRCMNSMRNSTGVQLNLHGRACALMLVTIADEPGMAKIAGTIPRALHAGMLKIIITPCTTCITSYVDHCVLSLGMVMSIGM